MASLSSTKKGTVANNLVALCIVQENYLQLLWRRRAGRTKLRVYTVNGKKYLICGVFIIV